MKQTAVEWLQEQYIKLESTLDAYNMYALFEQAKQMEAEQSKIPELSDEEIKEIAAEHLGDRSATNIYYWLIEGMQLYREQLKQRQ